MTEADLTDALDHWSATLRPHEHPPVILERLRAFSLTGLVPLDWADQEREPTSGLGRAGYATSRLTRRATRSSWPTRPRAPAATPPRPSYGHR